MKTCSYKGLTHDYRPPVQGGEPVFDGRLPFALPMVAVDESSADCGAGWNACRDLATALRIAGPWPDGWPSRLFAVETDAAVVERGDKLRASTWTLTRECSEAEIEAAVRVLSAPFGEHAEAMIADMIAEQMAWRRALARPGRDEEAVEVGLRAARPARRRR